jgi:hypothetical protein
MSRAAAGIARTSVRLSGDPGERPAGTVCLSFDDGYMWLIADSVAARELRVEEGRTIDSVLGASQRYEHVLETYAVQVLELPSRPSDAANSAAQ